MIKLFKRLGLAVSILLLSLVIGCKPQPKFNSSPLDNYNELWKILNEGYCFFDEKLPPDSTWEMMYYKHLPKIKQNMSNEELFDVFCQLMYELKDGHVTLYSSFDRKSYNGWRDNYPPQVDTRILSKYAGNEYRIAGGLLYNKITYNNHLRDSIGFIYYNSFMNGFSHANINAVLQSFKNCKGLIIDIRNNGGGNVSYVSTLASHFAKQKTLVGNMRYKAGPQHNNFSNPQPLYLEPTKYGYLWHRPVVVLTNRGIYSAANDFTLYMKAIEHITLLGDTTGGGGGLPRGAELPNGWRLRYSASATFDANGNSIEFGIAPNIKVDLSKEDVENGKDTLIEKAIEYINKMYTQATPEQKNHYNSPLCWQNTPAL